MSSKYVADFKIFLLRKGHSKVSIIQTSQNIEWLLKSNVLEPDRFQEFILSKLENERTVSYVNRLIANAKLWGEFNNIPELQDLKFMKDKHKPVRVTLTDEQIQKFLSVPQDEKYKAIWYTLAYTGMRPNEALHVKANDIDFLQNHIVVRESKTGEPRFIPMAQDLRQVLEHYIKNLKTDYLFYGLTTDALRKQFNRRLAKVSISKVKGLSTYSLRHSFITSLVGEDVAIQKVQAIAGHKKLDTTARYTHLSSKHLQDAIKKLPMVRKSLSAEEIKKHISDSLREIVEYGKDKFDFDFSENEKEITFKLKKK